MAPSLNRAPVLVTGANGFIGARLVRRLCAAGGDVRALVRPGADLSRLDGLPVQVVRGDPGVPASLEAPVRDVDIVFHLAATTRGLDAATFTHINVGGTRNLLEACAARSTPVSRFVLVSSMAAAGPSRDPTSPVTEESEARPVSWYGRSKLAAEALVRARGDVAWTVVRPAIVYGPGDRALLDVARLVRWGIVPVATPLSRRFSIVYVDDLVDLLVRSATDPQAHRETFLLAAPEPVTLVELGRAFGEALGRRTWTVPLPAAVVKAAGHATDLTGRLSGRPHIFGSQKAIEMTQPGWVIDSGKAARLLDWAPPTTLRDGLREAVGWWRQEGWL